MYSLFIDIMKEFVSILSNTVPHHADTGLGVGFVLPLVRSALFYMPVMFPTAIAMAFELAAYGLVIGLLYAHSRWQCVKALYKCLIPAMIAGRLVWGVVMVVLMGLSGGAFTLELFMAGAVVNALPGIALQLVLIPAVMVLLDRTKLVRFTKPDPACRQAG